MEPPLVASARAHTDVAGAAISATPPAHSLELRRRRVAAPGQLTLPQQMRAAATFKTASEARAAKAAAATSHDITPRPRVAPPLPSSLVPSPRRRRRRRHPFRGPAAGSTRRTGPPLPKPFISPPMASAWEWQSNRHTRCHSGGGGGSGGCHHGCRAPCMAGHVCSLLSMCLNLILCPAVGRGAPHPCAVCASRLRGDPEVGGRERQAVVRSEGPAEHALLALAPHVQRPLQLLTLLLLVLPLMVLLLQLLLVLPLVVLLLQLLLVLLLVLLVLLLLLLQLLLLFVLLLLPTANSTAAKGDLDALLALAAASRADGYSECPLRGALRVLSGGEGVVMAAGTGAHGAAANAASLLLFRLGQSALVANDAAQLLLCLWRRCVKQSILFQVHVDLSLTRTGMSTHQNTPHTTTACTPYASVRHRPHFGP